MTERVAFTTARCGLISNNKKRLKTNKTIFMLFAGEGYKVGQINLPSVLSARRDKSAIEKKHNLTIRYAFVGRGLRNNYIM